MNTLDILLKEFKWQGGTLHDAIEHFSALELKQQDKIMNKIMDNIHKIIDIDTVESLMAIRNRKLIREYGR